MGQPPQASKSEIPLGERLNAEFDAIQRSIRQIVDFLAVSFDENGRLKPEVVASALSRGTGDETAAGGQN